MQVWNDDLARVAQQYAENCTFLYNADRTRQQNVYSYVGENMGLTASAYVDYTLMIQSWNDDVYDYNYATNHCYGGTCGKYTQVYIRYYIIQP